MVFGVDRGKMGITDQTCFKANQFVIKNTWVYENISDFSSSTIILNRDKQIKSLYVI